MPICWHKIANEVAHTIFKLYGLFFQYRPQYEPDMIGCRAYQTVVLRHDAETFSKGGFLVLRRHALVQIVDYREMRVVQRLCLFHDADAPVEVGGKAVLQVVRYRQTPFGEECLMADEHTLSETFPCQHFGGGETAHTYEMPFFVY